MMAVAWLTTALVVCYITKQQTEMIGDRARVGYIAALIVVVASVSNILNATI